VVLGALLVVLAGMTSMVGRTPEDGRWLRPGATGIALMVTAPLCVLASPYGLDLLGYYESTLFNPLLPSFLHEWRASTPSFTTALFYVVAFATTWLMARHGDRLERFEVAAIVVLLAGGLLSVRSIVWFALACLVILPVALDGVLASPKPSWGSRWLAAAAVAGAAATLLVTVNRSPDWYEREWPTPALARIDAVASDRSVRVLADDRHADWLLWKRPQLRGRIAYDVRFELFTASHFERLVSFRGRVGSNWTAAAAGYSLLTFDLETEPRLADAFLRQRATEVVYRDRRIAVVANADGGRPSSDSRNRTTLSIR
jgi:hypothetical protein